MANLWVPTVVLFVFGEWITQASEIDLRRKRVDDEGVVL